MRRRRWTRPRTLIGAGLVALLTTMLVTQTEIDVPASLNIPGVDLPFVGDDPLVCDVELTSQGIEVVLSGGDSEIDDYIHVWLNGDVVDGVGPTESLFVIAQPERGAAHIAVSTTTDSATRFWCGTIGATN